MVNWRNYSGTGLSELLRLRDQPTPRLDVHWEPSPRDVVAEMLTMAEVGADDVLFDLGCGDGRIVIEAARQRGAQGVGIDLDPRRIRESVESTDRAGVRDCVRFLNEDLFEADISEATVVALFLFPDVNLRLRSKLLKDLKPGTRVVSYCHSMEQWQPDRTCRIRTNHLYCWVIPGNVSGRWEGAMEDEEKQTPVRLDLQQEFQRVKGVAVIGDRALTVEDAVMKGRAFSFSFRGSHEGNGTDLFLDGIVQGETITGTHLGFDCTGKRGRWSALRDPSTKAELAHN